MQRVIFFPLILLPCCSWANIASNTTQLLTARSHIQVYYTHIAACNCEFQTEKSRGLVTWHQMTPLEVKYVVLVFNMKKTV